MACRVRNVANVCEDPKGRISILELLDSKGAKVHRFTLCRVCDKSATEFDLKGATTLDEAQAILAVLTACGVFPNVSWRRAASTYVKVAGMPPVSKWFLLDS